MKVQQEFNQHEEKVLEVLTAADSSDMLQHKKKC